jgi:hypothetical protein
MGLLAAALAKDENGNQVTNIKANPVNLDAALKDAIRGTGAPADWMLTEGEIAAETEANEQQASLTQAAGLAGQAAEIGGMVGESTTKLREAGLI